MLWGKNIILHLHVFPMHLNTSKHFIIQHNMWTVIRIEMGIKFCFTRKSHSHSVHVSSPSDRRVCGTFSSPDKTDSVSLHGVCVSAQEKKSHPAKAVVKICISTETTAACLCLISSYRKGQLSCSLLQSAYSTHGGVIAFFFS